MSDFASIYGQRGRIFDLQRYSIHDGPGIRTIVFLKGCWLRCRWCCNPESQEYRIQEMTMNGVTKTVGRDVTVGELLPELQKDRMYYNRSGGGITLSGGECMAQPDFAAALLQACHNYDMNTAIETTAFADREVVERIIPHVDYVLMDIKHMDPVKHKAYTGQSNEKILDNARWIASHASSLTIRVPVIPTFNDSVPEIQAIARFAGSLPGVKALHLLPYHRLGTDKYVGIGRPYTLPDLLPPTSGHMADLLSAAEAVCDLHVQIGG